MLSKPQSLKFQPTFFHASMTVFSVALIIGLGIFFHYTLHSLLFLAVNVVAISTFFFKDVRFKDVQEAIDYGISLSLPTVYIFFLIGIFIAACIESGSIATLMFYVMEFFSIQWFFPSTFVLCCVMSLATGTSWGTAGTLGVALMGISEAIEFPSAITAGAIISGAFFGAFFGDKLSPLSDTTNLAASSAGTLLMKHIYTMLLTSVPSFFIALFMYYIVGVNTVTSELYQYNLVEYQGLLLLHFNINILMLLPFFCIIYLSIKRYSPVFSLAIASLCALALAVFFQEIPMQTAVNALFSGGSVDFSDTIFEKTFSAGGIVSVTWTLTLALLSLALGSLLCYFNFLKVFMEYLFSRIKSNTLLIFSTILFCFFSNLLIAEVYLTLILGGQLFQNRYDDALLDRSVLSRSLEEGGTLTGVLIPWTTAGLFMSSVLHVRVLDFLPYAFFNLVNPIVSIILSLFGLCLVYSKAITKDEEYKC